MAHQPSSQGAGWALKARRPEASLPHLFGPWLPAKEASQGLWRLGVGVREKRAAGENTLFPSFLQLSLKERPELDPSRASWGAPSPHWGCVDRRAKSQCEEEHVWEDERTPERELHPPLSSLRRRGGDPSEGQQPHL